MQTTIEPASDTAPLPFDRRRASRHNASGEFVAVVIDGDESHIATVEKVDESGSGLGVRSPMPMPLGSICHLHPHGVVALADVGRVARCEKIGDFWSIGLVSLNRMAA